MALDGRTRWPRCLGGIWALSEILNRGQGVSDAYYSDSIVANPIGLDSEWHTYRLEVQGNVVRLFIDGDFVAETTDNRFLEPGQVGLWSDRAQFSVRSFRVIAL